MFNIFKKASPEQKLEKQYRKLLDEAYKFSHVDRKASDAKTAEAEAIAQELATLRAQN